MLISLIIINVIYNCSNFQFLNEKQYDTYGYEDFDGSGSSSDRDQTEKKTFEIPAKNNFLMDFLQKYQDEEPEEKLVKNKIMK